MEKKSTASLISIITFLLLIPAYTVAQVQELCSGGSTTVMNGEYNVMNNVWGAQTGQCIEVDLESSYFRVSLSEHNNGNDVAAYPAIFKGCHWGWCTSNNNPMPISIKNIESSPFTWSVNTEDVSGTWNAALDIWFSEIPTGNNYSAELMIWFDYNGGAAPAGSRKATLDIGGVTWELHFAAWTSWNYIAFKAVTPVDSADLDLRDFINEAAVRGYLFTPWYLHAIEAGFEIWNQGQGLTTNYFSADVIDTDSPMNFAPSAFRLQSPSDGSTADTTAFTFKWQEAPDPDLDAVKYNFYLMGPDRDTVITGLDTNNLDFDGSEFFKSGGNYTWYVVATDNIDTTMSSTQRTFSMPGATDINHEILQPDKFNLYQNYPNPFNPDTRITYSLNKSSKVRLSVYDVMGRELNVLVDGYQRAGLHDIVFSGDELPSGIYICKLQTNNEILSRKMTLLK